MLQALECISASDICMVTHETWASMHDEHALGHEFGVICIIANHKVLPPP
jgi:hypothetical protein